MKILLAITLCLLISFSNAMKITYKDCGSTGMVKMVDLSPCTAQPCVLKVGATVNMTVDFVSKMATQSMTAVLMGIIDGVPTPTPLPNPNACTSGVKCPVAAAAENLFRQSIYIEYDFPLQNLQAQLQLKDDKYNTIVCAQFPVTISE